MANITNDRPSRMTWWMFIVCIGLVVGGLSAFYPVPVMVAALALLVVAVGWRLYQRFSA